MSIFNWWHYKDMAEYFQEVPGVNRMTFSCLVEGPAYCSPLYLSPKHVEEGKQVFLTFLQENYSKQENALSDHTGETWQHKKNKNFRIHRVENLLAVQSVKETLPKKYHSQRKHIKPWLQFCNNFRNVDFDIRDIVPELNDIEKEINAVI
jgi:Sec7-like guanine-nucleotide exchange factor